MNSAKTVVWPRPAREKIAALVPAAMIAGIIETFDGRIKARPGIGACVLPLEGAIDNQRYYAWVAYEMMEDKFVVTDFDIDFFDTW